MQVITFVNVAWLTSTEYTGVLQEKWLSELVNLSYHRFDMTCLFYLDSKHDLEAIQRGSIAKFANHAVGRTANAATASILGGRGSRHVVLYAIRDIRRGTEVLYDCRINGRTPPSLKASKLATRKSIAGDHIPPDQAAYALPILFPGRTRFFPT